MCSLSQTGKLSRLPTLAMTTIVWRPRGAQLAPLALCTPIRYCSWARVIATWGRLRHDWLACLCVQYHRVRIRNDKTSCSFQRAPAAGTHRERSSRLCYCHSGAVSLYSSSLQLLSNSALVASSTLMRLSTGNQRSFGEMRGPTSPAKVADYIMYCIISCVMVCVM